LIARGVTTDERDLIELERTALIIASLDRGQVGTEHLAHAPTKMRVLVVDPDPPGRLQLAAELEQLGWECQAVATGTQTVELMSQLYFDTVFADIAAPEIDGLKLCRAIKKSKRIEATRVIATTSAIDSGQVSEDVLRGHAADVEPPAPLHARELLQQASRWAEAVDEYEATVELQPQYFPALTRLA
jgi:CheY-like chemotaxis protein